jgi:hypothetical protein
VFSKKDIESIAKDYFDGNYGSGDLHPLIWNKVNSHLRDALDGGFGKWNQSDVDLKDLHLQLRTNVAVFSAFKNHQQAKELHSALIDEDGKKRSFAKFLSEAQKINSTYNQLWLEAEYSYATRAARSAIQWKNFEKTKESYPNLIYKESRSGTPRPEHKQYYGLIFPIDHPFWDEMMPPNGWGCKCSVQRTDESPSQVEVEPVKQIPGIPGNPGKAEQLFTSSHPYSTNISMGEKSKIQKQLNELNKFQILEDATKVGGLKRIMTEYAKWFPEEYRNGVGSILQNAPSKKSNGYTYLNGDIYLKKERLGLVKQSFLDIKNGKKLSWEQEDAMATFLHELVHNRNVPGQKGLGPDWSKYSRDCLTMEMCNEWVTRQSLETFYTRLGGKMSFPDLVKDRQSTGYNSMVRNLDAYLLKQNLKNKEVLPLIEEHLYNGRYSDQYSLMQKTIKTLSGDKITLEEAKARLDHMIYLHEDKFKEYLDGL